MCARPELAQLAGEKSPARKIQQLEPGWFRALQREGYPERAGARGIGSEAPQREGELGCNGWSCVHDRSGRAAHKYVAHGSVRLLPGNDCIFKDTAANERNRLSLHA